MKDSERDTVEIRVGQYDAAKMYGSQVIDRTETIQKKIKHLAGLEAYSDFFVAACGEQQHGVHDTTSVG